MKALELQRGSQFTKAELKDAFNQWYAAANKQFLRHTREDYFMEFLAAYPRVEFPLGSGKDVPLAWQRALSNPPPLEAEQFENPDLRRVVALCYELQAIHGNEPFFLSARTVQRLLAQKHHSTAAKWLAGLCTWGVIRIVKPGTKTRATRYRYASTNGQMDTLPNPT